MENKKRIQGSLLLLFASFIWGGAFVAQRVGMDYIGPLTFNFLRSFIGSLVLLPVILVRQSAKRKGRLPARPAGKKSLLTAGLLCGLVLSAGSILQQVGIQYTSVGKAGFLTALYIVIVPVLGIILGKKPHLLLWCSVVTALLGTYLLSVQSGFSISAGDIIIIISAFCYSFHILLVDHFAPHVDNIQLSCLQFLVSGTVSLVLALFLESPGLFQIGGAWIPLLYTGVLSSGVAYTLQIIGQRRVGAAAAPVIMSMESVFAALAGWLILRQPLSPKEIVGCVLVFAAVLMAQMPKVELRRRTVVELEKQDKLEKRT